MFFMLNKLSLKKYTMLMSCIIILTNVELFYASVYYRSMNLIIGY